jgi:hypothetical protein
MVRLRALLAPALLGVASVALTLGAVEAFLRVAASFDRNHLEGWVEPPVVADDREVHSFGELIRRHPDDRIVYELRPGTRARYLGQPVRINALGMRDDETSVRKPPGRFRILALGDSHLFGWAVGQDDSFAQQLEQRLEALAPGRFEVLNAGVPGYNTVMEARYLELNVDALAPDLVLVHYVDNDMDLPNFLSEPADPWTLRRSYLVDLVRRRVMLLAGEQMVPRGLFMAALDRRENRFRIPEDQIPERYRPLQGWDRMVEAYRKIAALARARGIPFAVLVNDMDFRARLAGKSDSVLPPHVRELAAQLAAEGWLVIEPEERTLAHLRAHGLGGEALWALPTDSHMNALHHRLAAAEILVRLRQEGWIDLPQPTRPARAGDPPVAGGPQGGPG